MNNSPQNLMLLHEEIPDDEALLDELIALVDSAISAQPRASPHKNLRKIISAIVFYALLLSLIAGAFFLSRGEKKPIFGYSFMNVLTWSMEPEIPQGSLVIIKSIDPNEIQIGDDITFTIDPQTSVTHRVIGIMEGYENSGARGFETQGIDNDTPDFEIVPAINVVGVVKFHVPMLGGWLDWLGSNLWLVLGFAVGISLLIFLLKGAMKKPPNPPNTTVYTDSTGAVRVNKTTHSERKSNHMKGKFKRILYSSGAVVVATALAVGGTFAYRNWERKSNVLTGKAQHQARLIEDYAKNPEWVAGAEIKKEVKVRNMGGVGQYTGENWGNIYVGIRLLEYLDITPYTYTYITGEDTSRETGSEPIRFMVNTNGEFVRLALTEEDFAPENKSTLRDKIAAYSWKTVITGPDDDPEVIAKRNAFIDSLVDREWLRLSGLYDTDENGDKLYFYYLPTKAGDPNGQYGAYVVKEAKEDESKRTIIAGTKRLSADGQATATNTDYLTYYQPHLWADGAENSLVHEYIEIKLGEHKVEWVYYTEWANGIETEGGVWILDNRPGSEGWAYWSEALAPKAYTDLLVRALEPLVAPEESIYYDLYVLMEAYSKDEIPSTWPTYEAPAEVFWIDPLDGLSVKAGEKLTFKAYLGTGDDKQDITSTATWSLYEEADEYIWYDPEGLIEPMSIGTPNTTSYGSKLSGSGTVTLTTDESEPSGYLEVWAEHDGVTKKARVEVTGSTVVIPENKIGIQEPGGEENGPDNPFVPKVVIGTDDADTSLKSDFVTFQTNYNGNNGALIGIVTNYAYMEHNGYIYLKDIIDDEYLDGIEIDYPALSVSSGGELDSSNIWIDTDDRTGEDNPAIIYNYVPSSLNGIPSPFYFDAEIRLTRTLDDVEQEAKINVRLTYGTEAKQFAPFVVNF